MVVLELGPDRRVGDAQFPGQVANGSAVPGDEDVTAVECRIRQDVLRELGIVVVGVFVINPEPEIRGQRLDGLEWAGAFPAGFGGEDRRRLREPAGKELPERIGALASLVIEVAAVRRFLAVTDDEHRGRTFAALAEGQPPDRERRGDPGARKRSEKRSSLHHGCALSADLALKRPTWSAQATAGATMTPITESSDPASSCMRRGPIAIRAVDRKSAIDRPADVTSPIT